MSDRLAIQAVIKRATQAAQDAVVNLDADTLAELEKIYHQAAADIGAAIERNAGMDGNVTLAELQSALAQVNAKLRDLSYQRDALLNGALTEAAALGVDPSLAAVMGAAATMTVPAEAVSFVRNFVAADGLQLSDRIWRVDRMAKDIVTNAIESAVIQGHGAAQAARDLLSKGSAVPSDVANKLNAANAAELSKSAKELMTGQGSPLDNAMRLFRTEINRAHGTAYMMGAAKNPDVAGFKFLLSPSHPKHDICDLLSTQNLYGLGAGVYPKDKIQGIWPAHPNTLSFVVAVFKDEVSGRDKASKETPMEAMARLSPAQRQGALGMAKSQAYDDGKISQGMIRAPWRTVKKRISADS
ncbi:MAG: hypothetical protein LLG15_07645 [Betaproteobacteria bacterium]|nr:hypothetical protein [Betaproteobacteria bacterium]